MHIDLAALVPMEALKGQSPSETAALTRGAAGARDYLKSFRWCGGIAASYVGIAIPEIVMVVLHNLLPLEAGVDEWLWTVTGDLPSAYLVTDEAKTPTEALEAYVGEMRAWVEAVRLQQPTDDLIPVNAPATPEYAAMLDQRLTIIERTLLEGDEQDDES